MKHMTKTFKLNGTFFVSIDNENPKQGDVQINTTMIQSYPLLGKYFTNVPVTIKALPKPGYKFVKWESNFPLPEKAEVTLDGKRDSYFIKPVFKKGK